MASRSTFLSPGQRYAELDAPVWRPERQITIASLDRDHLGVDRVTFLSGDGREYVAFIEQVEAAVVAGTLVPVVNARRPLLAA